MHNASHPFKEKIAFNVRQNQQIFIQFAKNLDVLPKICLSGYRTHF